MRLFLTRHAETLENARKIVQAYGGTISPLGKKQEKQLTFRLKNEEINHIYSSDIQRAVSLTEKIRKFHPNVPLTLTENLREVDFSKYLGNSTKSFDWKIVKDLESQEYLQKRARRFYEEIIEEIPFDKTALVVSHAGPIKAIISVILKMHYNDIWDMETPKNCSLSLFEIYDKKPKVVMLNNTDYLRY